MNAETSKPGAHRAPNVHVILVHGVGDRKPGIVLRQAVEGIARTFGKDAVRIRSPEEPAYQTDTPAGVITAASARVETDASTVALTEFHWGIVTGPIQLRKPLDAIRHFVGVLRLLPTLALSPSCPPLAKSLARAIGWLEAAACSVMLLSFVVAVGESFMPNSALVAIAKGDDSRATSVEWPTTPAPTSSGIQPSSAGQAPSPSRTPPRAPAQISIAIMAIVAGVAIMYLVLFLSTPVLLLQFAVNHANPTSRGAYARLLLATIIASLVNVFSLLVAMLLLVAVFMPLQQYDGIRQNPWLVIVLLVAILLLVLLMRVIAGVVGLVRDVAVYLGHGARGEPLSIQGRIQDELLLLLRRVHDESPMAQIVLICHSLGSVLVTDLLQREAARADGSRLEVDLVTVGSPLRRLIHRVLPQRALAPPQLRTLLKGEGAVVVRRWFNCFRVLDYVGQALSFSYYSIAWLLRRRPGATDPVLGIHERCLKPWLAWRVGHTDYWRDARFVRFVASEVLTLRP